MKNSARTYERPIFLHFLNREAAKATGQSRLEADDIFIIDVLTICHACGFSVNISQMIEYSSSKYELVSCILDLNKAGILINTSHDSNIDMFLANRQKMYSPVSHLYKMYFVDDSLLRDFSIQKTNHFSMTRLLRRDILESTSDQLVIFTERARDPDVALFRKNLEPIREVVFKNSELAITRSNIEQLSNPGQIDSETLSAVGRILSARYFHNYSVQNGEAMPTGIGKMTGFVDDFTYFPHHDVPLLSRVLESLGWKALRANTTGLRSQVLEHYATDCHQLFVHALNSLILAYYDSVKATFNKPISLPGVEQTVRKMMSHAMVLGINEAKENDRLDTTSFPTFLKSATRVIEQTGLLESRRNAVFRTAWDENMPPRTDVKVLIVTATDKEDAALQHELSQAGFTSDKIQRAGAGYVQRYSLGPRKSVFLVRSSAGSVGASGSELVIADAIKAIAPEFVVASGICFGLKEDKQSIGDILVSADVADYEMIREQEDRPVERGPRVPAGTRLLSAARILKARRDEAVAAVHIGQVISGLKLVDSRQKVEELSERFPDAIGGEMEASGLMAAASRNGGVEWIVVKAICDWAHGKGDNDQELAASNAASFAVALARMVIDTEIEHINGEASS